MKVTTFNVGLCALKNKMYFIYIEDAIFGKISFFGFKIKWNRSFFGQNYWTELFKRGKRSIICLAIFVYNCCFIRSISVVFMEEWKKIIKINKEVFFIKWIYLIDNFIRKKIENLRVIKFCFWDSYLFYLISR